MPELPEVQTIVDDLNASRLTGSQIRTASVFWERTVHGMTAAAFCGKIKNRRINAIRRRGKYIVIHLENDTSLLIHLRMSGRLILTRTDNCRDKHEHVWLTFTDGRRLRFHDTRKFGRMYLVDDSETILKKLGPEPLDPGFTAKKLAARLQKHRRLLKPLLLDQAFVAGLGNIYVDEALWAARLHPCRISNALDAGEMKQLHRTIRLALRRGLKNLGTSLGTGEANFYSVARRPGRNKDELKVFRRNGRPCARCRTTIERIIVGQRSTHICPECQQVSK
jgi:formamidopyrimidine-DNA glycosylase